MPKEPEKTVNEKAGTQDGQKREGVYKERTYTKGKVTDAPPAVDKQ